MRYQISLWNRHVWRQVIPKVFFEAFANIYTEFADTISGYRKQKNKKFNFPTVEDGVKGMKFIFAAKKSSNNNARWIKL